MAHHVVMPLLEQIPVKSCIQSVIYFRVLLFKHIWISISRSNYQGGKTRSLLRDVSEVILVETGVHYVFATRGCFQICCYYMEFFGNLPPVYFFSLLNHSRVYKIERISTFQIAASDLKCLFFFFVFFIVFLTSWPIRKQVLGTSTKNKHWGQSACEKNESC